MPFVKWDFCLQPRDKPHCQLQASWPGSGKSSIPQKTKVPAKHSWLNYPCQQGCREHPVLGVQAFRRSGLGFALGRLHFFGADYVTDFKKQCLLPACQPANQPLIHKQTMEGEKWWAAFWCHLCCWWNQLKTAEVNKTDEIQEGKHEYTKSQSQASFYFLGLNIYVWLQVYCLTEHRAMSNRGLETEHSIRNTEPTQHVHGKN